MYPSIELRFIATPRYSSLKVGVLLRKGKSSKRIPEGQRNSKTGCLAIGSKITYVKEKGPDVSKTALLGSISGPAEDTSQLLLISAHAFGFGKNSQDLDIAIWSSAR